MASLALLAASCGLDLPPASTAPRRELDDPIRDLVRNLSHPSLEEAERAERALIDAGAAAAPHLRRALQSSNTEVRIRADRILRVIPFRDALGSHAVEFVEASGAWRKIYILRLADARRLDEATGRAIAREILADRAVRPQALIGRVLADRVPADAWILVELLAYTDSAVRGDAARALASLNAVEAADHLVPLLGDPECAAAAEYALEGLLGRDEAANKIRNLTDHPDPKVRTLALLKLRLVKGNGDRVAGRLNDPDPGVRATAVEVLSTLEGAARVSDRLQDADAAVRKAVIEALTRLQLQERMSRMLNDPDASVRRAAIAGFAQAPTDDRVAELAGKIADPDPGVRRIAVEVVARRGSREYAGALASALADTQPEVVYEALWALREIGDAGHGPRVAPLLKHEWPSVRRVATIVLGNWKFTDAIPQLRAASEKETDADTLAVMWSVLKEMGADRDW